MTTARHRQPRAHLHVNGANELPIHTNRPKISSGAENQRRTHRYRQKRLPTAIVTVSTFVLVVLLALVRRMFVILSSHEARIPVSSSLDSKGSLQATKRVLTVFLEPLDTIDEHTRPLPPRTTSASLLTKIEYPQVQHCSKLMETWPINEFPSDDPFLPWIHDVFPTDDGTSIQFVAQNKRRCHLGQDKEQEMKHWEPQISLLQPVPVLELDNGRYRLSSPQEATYNETRFVCRFHTSNETTREYITFSQFPFNYEYISWRNNAKPTMFQQTGKDNMQFWLSQVLFSCPIPHELQSLVSSGAHVVHDQTSLWLDLVPIRTPIRQGNPLFTQDHVGTLSLRKMQTFDAAKEWDTQHVLPKLQDSGRWANIPICQPPNPPQLQHDRHRLVACTWTAASYTRRGDAVGVFDTPQRLREWVLFHQMVGFEQLYVYDNTEGSDSSLEDICAEFDICTYHKWPAKICSNNRPNHPNPGERSSQYAAEASCRERYGPHTDWMAFIDTDEYLVPMKSNTWNDVLDEMDRDGVMILKMRSSRARPRLDRMEEQEDQTTCSDPSTRRKPFPPEPCVIPSKNETFLSTYNCEYIRPPRPDRFQRAMKQIYRPSHVLSHFVHYSTVTADVAKLYKDRLPNETYVASVHGVAWERSSPEIFLNELTQGTLLHAKAVLPHETMYRSSICRLNSTNSCVLGYECPAHVEFSDELHQKNVFQNDKGEYCNCWANPRVEQVFSPLLKAAMDEHNKKMAERHR